ncbi:16S rRNA (guanine(966)-N(2))-methyltransferase RsmD [Candidatus Vallotia tarda]|uniref:16S rRNA (Guanine(966)-N(2))-methyltransferase RsmD n=1 Tax=Candidatus Vallotiella hemipterorum TaxID=1177213 RepID=A0A916NK72_9BURK|nr:16S rRNA (guanine(966)-N(2))-methyltransferase RsmD [Candidatus Vallotia tarda]CAG7596577.1 16S rRNA (guanine(966)-N(2))-methyltransferase RsmD [Candidatus Vallotia tarda]
MSYIFNERRRVPFAKSTIPNKRIADSRGSRHINVRRHAPQQVRLIGGIWKRTLLPVLDLVSLRPTLDIVRETLFNWLGQKLDGLVCLDLFAGTGALGFEAASRGAQRVVMVEHDARIIFQISKIQKKLNAQSIKIVQADALQLLTNLASAEFDIAFLDPPFDSDLLRRTLPFVLPLMVPSGTIYIESNTSLAGIWNTQTSPGCYSALDWSFMQEWYIVRYGRTGAVHYHLIRRKSSK